MPDQEPELPVPSADQQGQYVVVARRYRPRDFTDLVGQQQVSTALANAINTNRVGHAYLFTGARGVGKTSTARILAKCLNCIAGPTPEPCGKCDNCLNIATGEDVDVLEIDGASNRGIDEIRQLRSNVNIRPSRSRYKVYIIDEVHMLTTPAFNALLKTLEEPPEHVKFIFCTTDPEKIPITVISRCQRFDFSGIQTQSIIGRLRHIVDTENVSVDEEALALLARRAGGSMRDSQSLLEQLLSFGGENITVNDVHALLGTANSGRIWQLTRCLLSGEAAQALAELDAAISEGADAGQIIEQLAGCFRDIMARLVGCPDEMLLQADSDLAELGQAAAIATLANVLAAAQILDEALLRMRQSTQARTVAETALVRACCLDQLENLATIAAQLRSGNTVAQLEGGGKQHATSQKKTSELTNRESRIDQPHSGDDPAPVAKMSHLQARQSETISVATGGSQTKTENRPEAIEFTSANLDRIWTRVLELLDGLTQMHASRCTAPAISAPNRLAIRFPATYTSSKAFCERPQQRQEIEQALEQVVGNVVRIDIDLHPEKALSKEPKPPRMSQAVLRKQVMSDPLVQKAAELFDATVISVESTKRPADSAAAD